MKLTPLKLRSAMQDGSAWVPNQLDDQEFEDHMDLVYEMYYSREEFEDERTHGWWRI